VPIKTSLSSKDIDKLLAQTTNLRDRMIVLFYYDTGCRCSELLQITWGNLDLENGTVLISHLKRGVHKICPKCSKRGGKNTAFCPKCGTGLKNVEAVGIKERKRIIDMGADLIQAIKDYTAGEEILQDRPLFKISRQAVYAVIRTLADKAGLGGKIMLNPETGKKHYVHPHSFRDALATDWLEFAKTDVNKQQALSRQLGHQDMSTTLKYNKLTPQSISKTREEVRNFRDGKK
jgi:integrase